ncbi:MAG: hypothetical protein U0X92_06020 [Anaerolineales bacterium]
MNKVFHLPTEPILFEMLHQLSFQIFVGYHAIPQEDNAEVLEISAAILPARKPNTAPEIMKITKIRHEFKKALFFRAVVSIAQFIHLNSKCRLNIPSTESTSSQERSAEGSSTNQFSNPLILNLWSRYARNERSLLDQQITTY